MRGYPAPITALLVSVAGCSPPHRPDVGFGGPAWRQLSPSVGASWFATEVDPVDCSAGLEPLSPSGAPSPPMPPARRENRVASATLELLVLWRGTPGWFLWPVPDSGASVSFADEVVYPRPGRDLSRGQGRGAPSGRRLGSTVTIRQGSVVLALRWDPERTTLYVQEHPVRLNGDNVVLVDDVDGPDGPRVAGTVRIDPGFSVRCLDEPPFRTGFEVFFQRSDELLAFLRCDVPLPDDLYPDGRSVSLTQRYMDEACARYASRPPRREPGP